jgi:hypothetical protein
MADCAVRATFSVQKMLLLLHGHRHQRSVGGHGEGKDSTRASPLE